MCVHIWQQLMVASRSSCLRSHRKRGYWLQWSDLQPLTLSCLHKSYQHSLIFSLGLKSCSCAFVLTSALSTVSVCYMRGLFARVTFSLRVFSTLHFACIFVLRSVFCFAGVQTLVYALLFSKWHTDRTWQHKKLGTKNTISLMKARLRNIGDSHPTIICKCL